MHRIAIIGGGLSGLATARALAHGGFPPDSIVVLDADDAARGSGSPCGLLHAFPGHSLKPGPATFDRLRTSLRWVRTIADTTSRPRSDPLYRELPMIRPIHSDDSGDHKRDSWSKHRSDFPAWFDSEWLNADSLSDTHPAVDADVGAIRYTPAMVVRIDALRRRLARQLAERGCDISTGSPAEKLRRDGHQWILETPGRTVEAERVVWACGAHLDDWFDLPAGPKAGELLVVEPDDSAPSLHAAVSGGGYVAPMPSGPDATETRWLVGATYLDPSTLDDRRDEDGIDAIRQKTHSIVPAVATADVIHVWRGVRFMLGHIAGPLVGTIPTLPDAFVAGAFGSKGLLRIPHAAHQLARRLIRDDAGILDSMRADHIDTRWWAPHETRISH